MKTVLGQGFAYTVIAIIVIVGFLIVAFTGTVFLITAISNLAIWPTLVAALFGKSLSIGQGLASGAALLIIILVGLQWFPIRMERSIEVFIMLFGFVVFGFFVLGLAGMPTFFFLKEAAGINLPGWSNWAIGAATILLIGRLQIARVARDARKHDNQGKSI